MNGSEQETAEQAVARVLKAQAEGDLKLNEKLAQLRRETEARDEAKRKQAEAAERDKVERRQQQQAELFEREHRPGMLAAWLTTGGDEASFETVWPALRQELQLSEARRAQLAAKAAAGALYRDL